MNVEHLEKEHKKGNKWDTDRERDALAALFVIDKSLAEMTALFPPAAKKTFFPDYPFFPA